MSSQDLFDQWAGEVQRLRTAHEAELLAQEIALKRKHQRELDQMAGGDWKNWRGTTTDSDGLRRAVAGVWSRLPPEVQEELEELL
jgi:hypothetical protein